MARARNIKPGFYLNEQLAGCSLMARFIFPGLWMHADREGRLEDRPLRLKASLLPYDNADMGSLLDELQSAGLIQRYEANGERYIQIETFGKHQNPHVREPESIIPAPVQHGAGTVPAQDKHQPGPADSLIPDSPLLIPEKTIAPDKPARFDYRAALLRIGVTDPVLSDWLTLRRQKRAPVTETVISGISDEASRAGITPHDALTICCQRGWQGFKADWLKEQSNGKNGSSRADRIAGTIAELTGANRQPSRTVEGTSTRLD